MQRISIMIPDEYRESFKKLAHEQKQKLEQVRPNAGYQELMRRALKEYLEKQGVQYGKA